MATATSFLPTKAAAPIPRCARNDRVAGRWLPLRHSYLLATVGATVCGGGSGGSRPMATATSFLPTKAAAPIPRCARNDRVAGRWLPLRHSYIRPGSRRFLAALGMTGQQADGYRHVILTHQGRGADSSLCSE